MGSGGYLHASSAQLHFLAFLPPRSSSTHINPCLHLLTGTGFQSLSHSIPESWLFRAWNSISETPQDTKQQLEKQSNHNEIQLVTRTVCHTGRRCSCWGEVEAPISFPSGYMEACRFSSAEELQVKGLQGAGEVRFSMLQAVVHLHQSSPGKTESKVSYRISSWHTASP